MFCIHFATPLPADVRAAPKPPQTLVPTCRAGRGSTKGRVPGLPHRPHSSPPKSPPLLSQLLLTDGLHHHNCCQCPLRVVRLWDGNPLPLPSPEEECRGSSRRRCPGAARPVELPLGGRGRARCPGGSSQPLKVGGAVVVPGGSNGAAGRHAVPRHGRQREGQPGTMSRHTQRLLVTGPAQNQ